MNEIYIEYPLFIFEYHLLIIKYLKETYFPNRPLQRKTVINLLKLHGIELDDE